MGNNESICIELEKGQDAQTAGEPLRGRVIVCTGRAIRRGELKLHMYGKEKVIISSSREEREFFSVSSMLRNFEDQPIALPGTFEHTFAINLPSCLPASASNSPGSHDNGFRIQYKLRAELPSLYKKAIYINVQSAPLPNIKLPYHIEPVSLPIQGLLMRRGTVTLGAKIEDVRVGEGEELDVHLACHNDSSTPIQQVQLRVIECLSWRTTRHEKHQSRTLVLIADVMLPGLNKSSISRDSRRRKTNQENGHLFVCREILRSLETGRNKVTITIPKWARDSFKGHLIHVWHVIEIQFKTATMARNPSTTMNISIGTPRYEGPPMLLDNVLEVAAVPPASLTPTALMTEPESTVAAPRHSVTPDVEEDNIPFASAMILPQEGHVEVTADVISLGGDSIFNNHVASLESLTPVPAPVVLPELLRQASLSGLMHAMAESSSTSNKYDLIHSLLQDPEWRVLLKNLSAQEYGQLVAHVRCDTDQMRVAEELAQFMQPDSFTCAHAAAVIQNTSSDWNRSYMIAQRLAPWCSDIVQNLSLILQHLHASELGDQSAVMGRDFVDSTMANANQRLIRQH